MELDPALEERVWAIVNRLRARVGGDEEPMRAGAHKQAFVPVGSVVLEPVETAPGFLLGSSPLVAVLPGPPRELQTMWSQAVVQEPLAGLLASAGELERHILRFFGLPEPHIAATLREIDADALPLEITSAKSWSVLSALPGMASPAILRAITRTAKLPLTPAGTNTFSTLLRVSKEPPVVESAPLKTLPL